MITLEELRILVSRADGVHSNLPAVHAATVLDAVIVEQQSICETCKETLRYVSVIHDGYYRAFAVCDKCETVDEF